MDDQTVIKSLVKQTMLSNGYWTLNKQLVQSIGLEAAFMLAALADADELFNSEDGWFYQTIETIENITTLSRGKQTTCIAILEKKGLIEVKLKGLPAKRHFKINHNSIASLFAQNEQTSESKTSKLDMPKSASNKDHIDKACIDKEHKDNTSSLPVDFADAMQAQCGRNADAMQMQCTPNDNEESYHESYHESSKQVPYEKIKDLFNSTCISLAQVRQISERRKEAIRARLRQYGSIEIFTELFEKAEASDFLKGKNNRKWQADFDWLLKEANMAKVLEDRYANKETKDNGPADLGTFQTEIVLPF